MASEEHEARSVVERAVKLSEDVVQALDDDAQAAIKAIEEFLVSVQEALPQFEGARTVEKKITESALKMAQQLIRAQSEFLQKAVDNAGKSLSKSDKEK